MQTVNIHEAKTHLSKLIAKGEPFIIAKSGKPLYKAVPIEEPAPAMRRMGGLEGMFTIPDDFDTMFQKEIEDMFGLRE